MDSEQAKLYVCGRVSCAKCGGVLPLAQTRCIDDDCYSATLILAARAAERIKKENTSVDAATSEQASTHSEE